MHVSVYYKVVCSFLKLEKVYIFIILQNDTNTFFFNKRTPYRTYVLLRT